MMDGYNAGKDIGGILARLEAIEKKIGCQCRGQDQENSISDCGPAKETDEEADGTMQRDKTAFAGCGRFSTGHIRTTRTPPENGYPSNVDYCQICCIGDGDDGWYYCHKTVNGNKVYAARGGVSVTVSCAGRNLVCSC